jgi:hypothetical protein
MAPTLTTYQGAACDPNAGKRLLDDLFELIRERLPDLAPDDPCRAAFLEVMPFVAQSLGKPLTAVNEED